MTRPELCNNATSISAHTEWPCRSKPSERRGPWAGRRSARRQRRPHRTKRSDAPWRSVPDCSLTSCVLGAGTCIDSASFLMLVPWPIGDKRTCRSDLCNNAAPLFAAKFWEKKPYEQWSKKEALKVLEDSPWGKVQKVHSSNSPPPGIASPGPDTTPRDKGGGDRESSPLNRRRLFNIRFQSAKPVRMALARLSLLYRRRDHRQAAELVQRRPCVYGHFGNGPPLKETRRLAADVWRAVSAPSSLKPLVRLFDVQNG